MSAALTLALLRSSFFRYSHRPYSLVLEYSEGIPPWVNTSRRTLTFRLVQILTAAGAQTSTIIPAFGKGGYREDHLFPNVRFEVDLSDAHFEPVRLSIVLLQQIRRCEEKRDINIDPPLDAIQTPTAILAHCTDHATHHHQLAGPCPGGVQDNVEGLLIYEGKTLVVRLDPPFDSQRFSSLQVKQIEFEHGRKNYPKPQSESTRGRSGKAAN